MNRFTYNLIGVLVMGIVGAAMTFSTSRGDDDLEEFLEDRQEAIEDRQEEWEDRQEEWAERHEERREALEDRYERDRIDRGHRYVGEPYVVYRRYPRNYYYGTPGYRYGYWDRPRYYRHYTAYPYGTYYGTPRVGYYDYPYGGGAVRVGPVQVFWR